VGKRKTLRAPPPAGIIYGKARLKIIVLAEASRAEIERQRIVVTKKRGPKREIDPGKWEGVKSSSMCRGQPMNVSKEAKIVGNWVVMH